MPRYTCISRGNKIIDSEFMFKITWDNETGGVSLSSKVTKETLGIDPEFKTQMPNFWVKDLGVVEDGSLFSFK